MKHNVKSIVAAAAIGFGIFGTVGCTVRTVNGPVASDAGTMDQADTNQQEAREDGGRSAEGQRETSRETDRARADASDGDRGESDSKSDARSEADAPREESAQRPSDSDQAQAQAPAEGDDQAEQAPTADTDGQAQADTDEQAKADTEEQPGAEAEDAGPQSRATLNSVIKWWSDGESEKDILHWIDSSGAEFRLTAHDVERLRDEAVSNKIISRMKQQNSRHASTAE